MNGAAVELPITVVRLTTAPKGKLELLDLRALGMEDSSTVAKRSSSRRPTPNGGGVNLKKLPVLCPHLTPPTQGKKRGSTRPYARTRRPCCGCGLSLWCQSESWSNNACPMRLRVARPEPQTGCPAGSARHHKGPAPPAARAPRPGSPRLIRPLHGPLRHCDSEARFPQPWRITPSLPSPSLHLHPYPSPSSPS